MTTACVPATEENILCAGQLLKDGQLVAFPTETVYGLGANAFDEKAVLEIFKAKGRPQDNPLIAHIWCKEQLDGICTVPERARILVEKLMPGPLTVLMPRKSTIPDCVTAGLPTVAVRMPSHPIAHALLKACNVPVVAPSANSSGRPSPTTAKHVLDDMDGKIPMILDGGECEVGVESTVVDVNGEHPIILRPGGVTKDMLEAVLGEEVLIAPSVMRPLQKGEKALSPGMMYRHYSPAGELTLVDGSREDVLAAFRKLYAEAEANGESVCLLCFEENMDALSGLNVRSMGHEKKPQEVAHRLFDLLREMDDEKVTRIYAQLLPAEGMGLAVMNRLGRAAAFRVIQAADVK